jgi:hypothetical protein
VSVDLSPSGQQPMLGPTSGASSNISVWLLAFAPLIGGVLESVIARKTDSEISQLWLVTVLLNVLLCLLDAKLLKNDGCRPPNMWAVFLIPVYLFKRANLLRQNYACAFVWIAAFLLSFGADRIVAYALPYAEGEYHLDETWTRLELKPGTVQHFKINGGSVRFKNRPEGPEYRLNLDGKRTAWTDLAGRQLNLLDPESADAGVYHSNSTQHFVRCETGSDCVLTIYYTKLHSAVNSAAGTAPADATPTIAQSSGPTNTSPGDRSESSQVSNENMVTWPAMSRTATAITGDISIGPDNITIARIDYPLALVRDLEAAALAEAGKIVSESDPSRARLYRTHISKDSHPVNENNSICGLADAEWMLAVYSKDNRSLSLAFFSSESEPPIDDEVLGAGHDLCGTFRYERTDQ